MPGNGTRTFLEPNHYEAHLFRKATAPSIRTTPRRLTPRANRRKEGGEHRVHLLFAYVVARIVPGHR
jgi:hypothetical protein